MQRILLSQKKNVRRGKKGCKREGCMICLDHISLAAAITRIGRRGWSDPEGGGE